MNQLPRWRIAVAFLFLAGLIFFTAAFAPIYIRNYKLHSRLSEIAQTAASRRQPDDVLRTRVLDQAYRLSLPVKPGDVHVERTADGIRIDVRYFVRVDLPGYTVDLHFHPSGGQ